MECMKNEGLPSSCAILGATGSVGEQALDVARALGVPIFVLSAAIITCLAPSIIRRSMGASSE